MHFSLTCYYFVPYFQRSSRCDDLDVLGAFSSLLRTAKELKRLSAKGLEYWPTYSAALKSLLRVMIAHVIRAIEHYSSNSSQYCSSVTDCLKFRLVRGVILVLETQGWQKIVDEETIPGSSSQAVEQLGERFKIPLENIGVELDCLAEEFHKMVLHATQFFSLSTIGYQAVW